MKSDPLKSDPLKSDPLKSDPLVSAPRERSGREQSKRKVEVSLVGKRFTVRSDKDAAYLHALANFVTRRFEELQHATRVQSSHDVALLVALNLADEIFQAEEHACKTRAEIRVRTERMLDHIDAAMHDVDDDVPVAVAVEHQA